MYPLYEGGDILFVENTKALKNNDIGIFVHEDDTVCKRYCLKDGSKILVSENNEYEPREVLPNDSFEIKGKVIGKYHVD